MIHSTKILANLALFTLIGLTDTATAGHYQTALMMHGGHPVVEVKIQGSETPLRFVVDTAAGGTVIDKQLAMRLHLLNAQDGKISVSGASGISKGLESATLTNLKIGNLTIATVKALSIELNDATDKLDKHIDGILGNDVMKQFDVTFDVSAGQLGLDIPIARKGARFAGPSCHPNANASGRARPASLSGFGFLDVGLPIGGEANHIISARAVIDTGAAQTVLNWSAARAIGLVMGDPALKKREHGTKGLEPKLQIDTFLYELPSLRLGSWQSHPLQVRISDLPVFESIGLSRQPAVILGIDILQQQKLSISKNAEWICFGNE